MSGTSVRPEVDIAVPGSEHSDGEDRNVATSTDMQRDVEHARDAVKKMEKRLDIAEKEKSELQNLMKEMMEEMKLIKKVMVSAEGHKDKKTDMDEEMATLQGFDQ